MLTILIVIHLMIVIALVAVVLLQRSEGGALGVGGGGGFMTGRGQANVLTRATAILAALFFATSLALTLIPRWSHEGSILGGAPAGGSETAPSTLPPKGEGTVLDQLRRLEQQKQSSGPGAAAPISNSSATPAAPPPAPSK